MDLESQMAFTTKSRAVPKASAPDRLTEILFGFNPAFMYQWIEDYSKTGQGPKLETIPHLSNYWNGVFQRAGVPEASNLFKPDMTEDGFLDTFQNHALPILRTNRKLLNHDNRH